MNQRTYQQPRPDLKVIETLKAARDQVIQADKNFVPLEARPKSAADTAGALPLTGFAEEFVQKLALIEREKIAVDEEMARVEKKKQLLEERRNELIKIKDGLKELDKEMSNALKFDPEQRRMGQQA